MGNKIEQLNLFMASPGDVVDEREVIRKVL